MEDSADHKAHRTHGITIPRPDSSAYSEGPKMRDAKDARCQRCAMPKMRNAKDAQYPKYAMSNNQPGQILQPKQVTAVELPAKAAPVPERDDYPCMQRLNLILIRL